MAAESLTRRRWLAQAGGVACAAWGGTFAVAATKGRRPIRFLVVSDTHVGHKGGELAHQRWEKTATEIAEAEGEFVLHLGDVVDGGRVEQYRIYLGVRERIGKPIYEIPGNHDPAEAFAEHIRREIDTVVDHQWLRCVLLNNARRTSHDGFFSAGQLDWLDRQCRGAERDNRLVIVCCHVPIHANRHPDRGWHVKREHGQTRFYEILTRHREGVIGVFHGHFHNGVRGWDDRAPLHEICFPSALYNQNRGLESKMAPGYNPNEFRPGYCPVTIGEGQLTLSYKPLGEETSVVKTLRSS